MICSEIYTDFEYPYFIKFGTAISDHSQLTVLSNKICCFLLRLNHLTGIEMMYECFPNNSILHSFQKKICK